MIRAARQLVQLAHFSVGMQVESTTDDGRTVQGQITRLNRKTATVCCETAAHWRVSPSLLRPLGRLAAAVAAGPSVRRRPG
jgi:hypothetical protein